MKLKALLAAFAASALSLSTQAASISLNSSQSYLLYNGLTATHATNSPVPQNPTGGAYAELIAPDELGVRVSLGYTIPADLTANYRLFYDTDTAAQSVSLGGEIFPSGIGTLTDLSPGNLFPFFSFLAQAGQQYVLQIIRGPGVETVSTNIQVSAVPLPGALWLFGSALLGFLGFSSRRKA